MSFLEVRDLTVAYGAIQAVRGVTFSIERGQVVSLIGSNGAGKTTTLRTISGLLRPVSGEVLLDGEPIHRLPAHGILARGVAHSPSAAAIRASRKVRTRASSGSTPGWRSSRTSFIATSRPSNSSVARHTEPIPPLAQAQVLLQAAHALQAVTAAQGGPAAGGGVAVPVLPQPLQGANGPRRGVFAAVIALLVVAGVITAIGLVAVNPVPPEHPRGDGIVVLSALPPAVEAAPAAPAIGDPRTTDPCSLVDAATLGRFGETMVDADPQAFSECSVNITLPSDVGVTFWVDLEGIPAADPMTSGVPMEHVGRATILRYPPGVSGCQRSLVLKDGNVVDIHAEFDDGTEPGEVATVCSIADAGTRSAVAAIEDDRIRRRDPADYLRSLAGVSPCDLLDQTDFRQLEGKHVPAVAEFASEAGWSCSFEVDDSATEYSPEVAFYRRPPLDDSDGTLVTVGGRPAAYGPPRQGEFCEVQIAQDSYPGADGIPRVIVVNVTVYGPPPEATRCDYARRAADLVAAKLPPV